MINIRDLRYHIHLLTSMINISDPNVGLTVQIPYTNEKILCTLLISMINISDLRYHIHLLTSMINISDLDIGLTVQIPYTNEKILYTLSYINDKHQ